MDRKITEDLLMWKSSPEHKPLIIKGVRQCGKTYTMKSFGSASYPDVAYFNFEEDNIAGIFETDLKVDRIVNSLGVYRSKVISEDTLIILDEIQNCPRAITSLKYFCEDGRYDVISAGSLLGVMLAESSPPVGKIDELNMYPLSFEEFLWACGERALTDLIKEDPFSQDVKVFSDRLIRLYREYLAVGGLPEAVASWTAHHDPVAVDSILRNLKNGYISDISRYGKAKVRENGELVWRSIPSQLAKDNKKFVMGHVAEGHRARDLWSSVDWLSEAGLVYLVPITTGVEPVPSYTSDPSAFKLYCFDTGLLRIMADLPMSAIIEDFDTAGLFIGACTENYALLELKKQTFSQIYCWRSGNRAEVDFLLRYDGKLIPVEVKSGRKTMARSLGVYLDSHEGTGIIASLKEPNKNGRVTFVPLYCLWSIGRFIESD